MQNGGSIGRARLYTLAVLILVSALGGPAPAEPLYGGSGRPNAVTRLDADALWARGWEQISRGQIDLAARTFREASEVNQGDLRIRNVTDWLAQYESIQQRRQALRQREFERYQDRCREAVARYVMRPLVVPVLKPLVTKWEEMQRAAGQADADASGERQLDNPMQRVWRELVGPPLYDTAVRRPLPLRFVNAAKAGLVRVYYRADQAGWLDILDLARIALEYADNVDEVLHSDWVQNIVRQAIASAETSASQQKWRDAAGIYYELETIFENEEPYYSQYQALRRKNQTRARLEFMYAPPDPQNTSDTATPHDETWQKIVKGIDQDIVPQVFRRIEANYVQRPDLAEILGSGLEATLLLTETPAIAGTFDGLKDEIEVRNFVTRVQLLIGQVRGEKRMTASSAYNAFKKLRTINRQTIRLPDNVLVFELIDGCMASLDQFSSVIWPSEAEEFRKQTTGEFAGVGIQINVQNEYVTVFSPLEDSPAYRAGIRPGDRIVRIDGEDAKGIDVDDAVKRITGPRGTTVVLTIRHEGEDIDHDVTLKRDRIVLHTVKGFERIDGTANWNHMIDPDMGVAYVRVGSFTEKTVRDLRQAIEDVSAKGARGLILDLRYNQGGLLTAAWEMAELFLPAGKRIVSTSGRDPREDWERTSGRPMTDLPLIVLINENSASASEIVSGAIKDHQRGLLVGERTYGKGSVQNLIPIADNAAFLKLTTAYYYLPSGRCLHRIPGTAEWGVDPDVALRHVPLENREVLTRRRNADVIDFGQSRGKDGDDTGFDEIEAESLGEESEDGDIQPEDSQLELALLLMRMRLTGYSDWYFPPETRIAVETGSGDPKGNQNDRNELIRN